MSIAALIRRMSDAGATPEAIAIAVEAIEIRDAIVAERKARDAAKTRLYRQRGGGKIPDGLRFAVLRRDDYTCQECGSVDYLQIDHVHPVSKGGATEESNLQVLCRTCNARKKDRVRKEIQRNSTELPRKSGDNPSPKKETSPTPPKEKTTPSSSGDKSPSRCERDFFAEFWLAYPSREGSNPKKPARERFQRLIAKGHDPESIIAAARQLATEHPTPTRFVPQAVTWLNQERFADAAPVMVGDEFCSDDWPNTRFLLIRFRRENSGSDPPRAVHGGKAGYLLPKEWVELSKQRQVANA